MITMTWRVVRCDYKDTGVAGQVVVTVLHWGLTGTEPKDPPPTDPEESPNYIARVYGTLPEGTNRTFTLPALEAVPEAIMVGWLHDAIDAGHAEYPDEQPSVAQYEEAITNSIEAQKNPSSGNVDPV